jgi:hypothetical protein
MIFSFKHHSVVIEDDESSTLTVEKQKKQLHQQDEDDQSVASTVTSSTSSSCKSVCFDMDSSTYYENKQICFGDCKDLWYTASEMKSFKHHTMVLAKEVQKAEARNRAPFSYHRVVLRTYEVCMEACSESFASFLSADERKHLRRWAEVAPSRLGLEKWAIRPIGRDRSVRRADIVDVVLDIQQTVNACDLDEIIRQQAETISRPSRLFARYVAQANAEAMLSEIHENEV